MPFMYLAVDMTTHKYGMTPKTIYDVQHVAWSHCICQCGSDIFPII